MLSKIVSIKTVLLVLVCTTIMSYAQAHKHFPYQLTKADVPPGFVIAGPFTQDEKSFSISANQGVVTDKMLIANIYNNIDVKTINRVYVTSYIPGKHSEDGMEVYIIEYKSKPMLDKEQIKLPRNHPARYLQKNNYLFIVWSVEYGFPKQVEAMAGHLKQRWSLTDITHKK